MLPVLPYVATNLRTTLRLLALVECKHPREPHWYLATSGTAVEQQGKGVGGALMRPVLDALRRRGLPCYLESSKERNVPFYRRHGFEVVEEVPLPGDGPTLWTMWREPSRRPEGRRACRPERRLAGLGGQAVHGVPTPAGSGGVDAFGHGEDVVHDDPEHVDDRPGRRRRQAPPPLRHADPPAGESRRPGAPRSGPAGGRGPPWPAGWPPRSRRRPGRR